MTSDSRESEQQSYRDDDDCPTEGAVLKREWREQRQEIEALGEQVITMQVTIDELLERNDNTVLEYQSKLKQKQDFIETLQKGVDAEWVDYEALKRERDEAKLRAIEIRDASLPDPRTGSEIEQALRARCEELHRTLSEAIDCIEDVAAMPVTAAVASFRRALQGEQDDEG